MGLEMDLTMCIMGLVLLVLTVLLSVLCSHCGRRSFELKDTTPEKGPSALVRVVKLEETREYPIKQKVKDHSSDNVPGMTPQWESRLEEQMNTGR